MSLLPDVGRREVLAWSSTTSMVARVTHHFPTCDYVARLGQVCSTVWLIVAVLAHHLLVLLWRILVSKWRFMLTKRSLRNYSSLVDVLRLWIHLHRMHHSVASKNPSTAWFLWIVSKWPSWTRDILRPSMSNITGHVSAVLHFSWICLHLTELGIDLSLSSSFVHALTYQNIH